MNENVLDFLYGDSTLHGRYFFIRGRRVIYFASTNLPIHF